MTSTTAQPVRSDRQTPKPPSVLRLANRFPWLRRIPARFIGVGVRPEHISK